LAIEHYHKALSLRSDDAFSQHHLELALIDQSAITVPKHEKVDFETAFPIGDPIAATPEAPSPHGGLFPTPSPQSFRSTPTFGQTFAGAAADESVDMDQSVDMDEAE
jgi:anaphase-promoting complex subunit 6